MSCDPGASLRLPLATISHAFSVKPDRPTQKVKRTCNWNIRGGSMFANAGIAFVAVPTPPTNWPKVDAGVAKSPYTVTPRPRKFP